MPRRVVTAELLAVGTELTIGATRDTNSGDIARDLTAWGVTVSRVTALPDDLRVVRDAFADALARADLVVSTGGLGPTPDDLTREAIAAALGATPAEDPELLAALEQSFRRRGVPMPRANAKQAWLIPGAVALPNPNGSAPGWWLDRDDGRIVIALPGPPREMGPMWLAEVAPRLRARGIGEDRASRTLRLTGVGESALVELIGESLLRSANPSVATYARADAVDVRIVAAAHRGEDGSARTAAEVVDAIAADLEARLSGYVFAREDETWVDALGRVLGARTLASLEIGTAGSFAALLGAAPWFVRAEVIGVAGKAQDSADTGRHAVRIRDRTGADLGIAIGARERGGDTAVTVAIASAGEVRGYSRTAFLGGDEGRRRAALVACATLWQHLRAESTA